MEIEENDKTVVLQVLKGALEEYNKTPANEIDTEFKKKLEKDINVFQNYVNYQSAGRRKKKTRKKKAGHHEPLLLAGIAIAKMINNKKKTKRRKKKKKRKQTKKNKR